MQVLWAVSKQNQLGRLLEGNYFFPARLSPFFEAAPPTFFPFLKGLWKRSWVSEVSFVHNGFRPHLGSLILHLFVNYGGGWL